MNYYNNVLETIQSLMTTNTNIFEQIYDVILGVGLIVLSILALVQLTATTINKFVEYSHAIDDDESESDDDNDNDIFTPPPRRKKQRANCNSPLLLKIK